MYVMCCGRGTAALSSASLMPKPKSPTEKTIVDLTCGTVGYLPLTRRLAWSSCGSRRLTRYVRTPPPLIKISFVALYKGFVPRC